MAPDVWPTLSVSNSLSGRHWELDQVPAVGDLTDIVQLGTGHHVSVGEGQRRVALQRRVAAYLVGGGQTPGATQRCLNPGFSERIENSRRTGTRRSSTRSWPTRDTTVIRRWWISQHSTCGPISRSPIAAGATGRTRRRRATRCTRIVDASGACVGWPCRVDGVSISNDRMRISMKPVGCGARICEGTPTS